MCGRYSLSAGSEEELRDRFGFDVFSETRLRVAPRYNIAPGQRAVVVEWDGQRPVLAELEWGFPRFKGGIAVNARVERAKNNPLFRDAYKEGRCLVPADGFYEWRKEGKNKQPYWFSRSDGQLLLFAGLQREGRFTIMTTDAGEEVREIHDRMPVIISAEGALDWLGEGKLKVGAELDRRQVSTRVNRTDNDDPGCIEPAQQRMLDFD